jgi:hypothetical protein
MGEARDGRGEREGSLEGMSKQTQEVGMWLVRMVSDNTINGRDNIYFGPFQKEHEAMDWMNAYPDDEDMVDMDVFWLNSPVLADGSPNH